MLGKLLGITAGFKTLVILLGLLGVAGWGVKHFYDRAIVQEAAYNSAMMGIEAISIRSDALRKEFQQARDEETSAMEVFDNHDLNKDIEKRPDAISRLANDSFDKLFTALENETRNNSERD